MAVGDFYRCSVIYSNTTGDGNIVNVFDYEQTDIVVAKTEDQFCNELASELRIELEDNYLSLISADWTLVRVDCFNITQPTFEGTSASGDPGTGAGDTVSIRSAVVVTKRTGFRGRSFRGRTFLPAPSENNQNGGEISAAYATSIGTFFSGILVLLLVNDNRYVMVVYSSVLVDGTQVGTAEVKTTLGSIRGRQKVNS